MGVGRVLRVLRGQADGAADSSVGQAPPVPIRTILRRFWPYAAPQRRWLPVLLLLVAIPPLVEGGQLLLFKAMIDDVMVPRDLEAFLPLAVAFLGLTAVGGVASYLDTVLSARISHRARAKSALRGVTCDYGSQRPAPGPSSHRRVLHLHSEHSTAAQVRATLRRSVKATA